MPIDPSQVAWDDDPIKPPTSANQDVPLEISIVGGRQQIDPAQVQWDDEPVSAANDPASARIISGQPTAQGLTASQGLGAGLRSVIQGTGGLIGAVGGDAVNYYLVPGEQPSYREAASSLADRLDLPKPQTAGERVIGDVGEALTGTALTMGAGAGINALSSMGRGVAPVTNRLADLLTAQPVQQALASATGSAASGITRESGGSQGQQLAAGLVGGIAPSAAATLGAAGLRGAVRGANGQRMQSTINDFNALGATPSVGQASGNKAIQGIESLLAGAPTSSGVMGRFAERQSENIGEGLQSTANGLARRASAEQAGRKIESGVQTFANNVKTMRRALYWQADRYIPDTTPTALSNTQTELTRLMTPTRGAEATTGAMINPEISRIAQNLGVDLANGGGSIPYAAVKELRSRIGEELSDFSLVADKPTRQYKQLYGALSRDLETAAAQMGPDAEMAARRANNYTRVSADRLEQIERVVDKNGGPERVFQAAMAGTRDGGTTLRAVMQSLPQDGQKAVTAAVIKRMGMATPGAQDAAGDVFSAGTFLTNWNRVSPEAKRALFDRYGSGFSQSMERIAKVADNIKTGSKVYANPSGTANRAAAYTYGASLVASMFDPTLVSTGSLVGGGLAANGAARYLTNPKAVKWLAEATKMPRGAFLTNLRMMSEAANRSVDEDMVQLASDLNNSVNQADSTQ